MKKVYFITATNTNIGKTYASELILKKFAKQGKKVGYLKPIETGVKDTPLDGTKLFKVVKKLNNRYKDFTIDQIVPYKFSLPAAPYVAKKDQKIKISKILYLIKYHLKFCDILVVEGAGGLMVPIKKSYFMIDLISDISKKFHTKIVLISSSNLGNINETLLSINMLNQYNIKFKWYINLYKNKNSFKNISLPFYKQYFKKIKYIEDKFRYTKRYK